MMGKPSLAALGFAAIAAAALLAPLPAAAQSAEQLRAAGQACELPNGYLRAIDNSVRAAVDRINDQRRGVYEQKAREEGVGVDAVGAVYAQQIRSQPNYRPC